MSKVADTPAKKNLTVKQNKFVKAYVSTDGNGTQAALQSYDTNDAKTAGVIAAENLAKPSVKQAIEEALEKHKITIDAAIKPIAAGLKAVDIPGYHDAEGKYHRGKPDHGTRLRASAMALKLLGAEQNDDTAPPASIHFHSHVVNKQDQYGL